MMDPLKISISVLIYQQNLGGQIRLEENLELNPAAGFMDLAEIMKLFHELASSIKKTQAQPIHPLR